MSKPMSTISLPAGNGSQIQISVWANEVEKNGQKFTTHAVTLQRRYNDNGEWKSTSSLHANDLLIAAHGLQQAYDVITKR